MEHTNLRLKAPLERTETWVRPLGSKAASVAHASNVDVVAAFGTKVEHPIEAGESTSVGAVAVVVRPKGTKLSDTGLLDRKKKGIAEAVVVRKDELEVGQGTKASGAAGLEKVEEPSMRGMLELLLDGGEKGGALSNHARQIGGIGTSRVLPLLKGVEGVGNMQSRSSDGH